MTLMTGPDCVVMCNLVNRQTYTRAFSLRNLVLAYECGRVFPVGVAKRLSSRFSRSVETRRRFVCLRMVVTTCASSELQFGILREVAARERQGAMMYRGKHGREQQVRVAARTVR